MKDLTRAASGIAVKGCREMKVAKWGPFVYTYTEMSEYRDWRLTIALGYLNFSIAWHV